MNRLAVAVSAVLLTAGVTAGVTACEGSDGASQKRNSAPVAPPKGEPTTPEAPDQSTEDWAVETAPDLEELALTLSSASTSDGTTLADLAPLCSKGLEQVHKLQEDPKHPVDPELWDSALNNTDKGLTACVNGDEAATVKFLQKAMEDFNALPTAIG